MFKKIMMTLIVLFLLAAAGLAFFIATFDADQYRSVIETKASELTGFPVKLGGVSLTWKNGIALEVRDLVLKVREEDQTPAPVSVRSAYVALEILPLLRGTLQMGSIIVEDPEVRLTRSPDGRWRGAAELGQARPDQKAQGASGIESTLALLIQNLNIRGGKLFFQDQYGGRVREYVIDQIELRLRDVSLLNSFPVELKAAVFSGEQNVSLTGNVQVRLTQQEVELKNFTLNTDLENLDAERLSKAFPELKESGIPTIAGHIKAHLSDVTLSEKTDPLFSAQIDLKRGRLVMSETGAIENIELSSEAATKGLHIKSFSADWAGGHLESSGKVDWRKAPSLKGVFQVDLSDIDLSQAVPAPASSRDPGVSGLLFAGLKGAFSGGDAEPWERALTGDGQILVKNGVITNLNVLKEVLNKLSIIPGVSQKIQERLSEEYLAKLQESDTRLEDVNLPLRISGGLIFMDAIAIQSDTFQITGRAQADFMGPLNGRLLAAVDPEFSLALMESVRELEYITDSSKQISIPLTIGGTFQKPVIIPEVQQLASRMAVAKSQELISGFLNKKKPEETQTVSDPSALTTEPTTTSMRANNSQPVARSTDPFAALLGQVLQAATQKSE